jgi:hypothetical protein
MTKNVYRVSERGYHFSVLARNEPGSAQKPSEKVTCATRSFLFLPNPMRPLPDRLGPSLAMWRPRKLSKPVSASRSWPVNGDRLWPIALLATLIPKWVDYDIGVFFLQSRMRSLQKITKQVSCGVAFCSS